MADRMKLPFRVGRASTESIRALTELDHQILYRQRPLPVPCSFLVDRTGRVAFVYKGPVEIDQLLKDMKLLEANTEDVVQAAMPLAGQNITRWFSPDRVRSAQAFLEGGYIDDAKAELNKDLKNNIEAATVDQLPALRLWSDIAQRQNDVRQYLHAMRRIATLEPNNPAAQIQLAAALAGAGNTTEAEHILQRFEQQENAAILIKAGQTRIGLGNIPLAIKDFQRAFELEPNSAEVRFNLALGYQLSGQPDESIDLFRALIKDHPSRHDLKNNLAWLLATESDEPKDHQEAVHSPRSVPGNGKPSGSVHGHSRRSPHAVR